MADSSVLPDKLFFRIGEAASLVGVEPHVLRYWEREFRSIRPTKSKKGQRIYSRKDLENLCRVRDLLYRDGFTIAGAKKKLQRGGTSSPSVDETRGAPAPDALVGPLEEGDDPAPSPHHAKDLPHRRQALTPILPATTRAQLQALRSEMETFLLELGGAPDSVGNSRRTSPPK